MEIVTISPKFQVVIPKSVREAMKLRAGQRVRVFEHDGVIELVPLRPMSEYRGILRGMVNDFEREPDREL